jgi:hypothetical protein
MGGVKTVSTGLLPSVVLLSSSSSTSSPFVISSFELLSTGSLSLELSSYSSWLLPATLVDLFGRAVKFLPVIEDLRCCTSSEGIWDRCEMDASEEEDGCDDISIQESMFVSSCPEHVPIFDYLRSWPSE